MASGAARFEAPSFRRDWPLVHLDESPAGWVSLGGGHCETPEMEYRPLAPEVTSANGPTSTASLRRGPQPKPRDHHKRRRDSRRLFRNRPSFSLGKPAAVQCWRRNQIQVESALDAVSCCTSASEMTGPAGAPRYRKSASLNEIAAFLRIGPRERRSGFRAFTRSEPARRYSQEVRPSDGSISVGSGISSEAREGRI